MFALRLKKEIKKCFLSLCGSEKFNSPYTIRTIDKPKRTRLIKSIFCFVFGINRFYFTFDISITLQIKKTIKFSFNSTLIYSLVIISEGSLRKNCIYRFYHKTITCCEAQKKKGCKTSGQKSCFHTVLHHFILSHFIFSGGNKKSPSSRRGRQVEPWWSGNIKMCFSELSCREAAVVSDRRLIRQRALTAPLPIFCAPKGTENPQGRLFSCRRMEPHNTKASSL